MTKIKILVMLVIAGLALRSLAQAPSPQSAPINTNPVNRRNDNLGLSTADSIGVDALPVFALTRKIVEFRVQTSDLFRNDDPI